MCLGSLGLREVVFLLQNVEAQVPELLNPKARLERSWSQRLVARDLQGFRLVVWHHVSDISRAFAVP